MTHRVTKGSLHVASVLANFVEDEILPALPISNELFWHGLEKLVTELGPRNSALMVKRDSLQSQIDAWYHANESGDLHSHKSFLFEIGYLVSDGSDFQISTENVDAEIAAFAGPQLVVPVSNARFALNAANARWGSLFDALYGTNTISEDGGANRSQVYNPVRGARVIARANEFLDATFPLAQGSHADVSDYLIEENHLVAEVNGGRSALSDSSQFVGFQLDESRQALSSILLRNNGLYIEILIDKNSPIGKNTPSGVQDIVLESAVSTIQDLEDSVSAVDAEEKTVAYRNWLGLMKGDLQSTFAKNGKTVRRTLNKDREFTSFQGQSMTLPGRSLMMIRHVGHAMYTDAVIDAEGREIPETFLDAMVTTACAMHDLLGLGSYKNSRTGSMYIVKPKMHGPEEVAFADELFSGVEDALGLARHTLKIGVMDEERRTTVNLKECIRKVKERLVFINTGFLDRTGDEIHTCMEGGAVLPKETIKSQPWLLAYENRNVDVGLACGLNGRAQIGKGMWAKPDEMADMMATKIGHLKAGGSCAWVPSPTAATLHAMHYHQLNVGEVQEQLHGREQAKLEDILKPPFLDDTELPPETIKLEVDNNVQGILGYVVRWIDQGIGCSKVPDINNTALMEDRATLRISSQHLSNWIRHGIISKDQLLEAMYRQAVVVDRQNATDPGYRNMSPHFESSLAFQAACELVLKGCDQANGYTETILHSYRREAKRQSLQYSHKKASISSI